MLEAYRRAGIRVLIWVPPLNVEQLHWLGFAVEGLDRTVAVIRQVVESERGILARLPRASSRRGVSGLRRSLPGHGSTQSRRDCGETSSGGPS